MLIETSQKLHDVATRLSNMIECFVTALKNQKGKCFCEVQGSDLKLKFDRSGSDRWALFVVEMVPKYAVPEYKLLTECSIRTKLKAIELFPLLLPKMVMKQEALIKDVEVAISKVESLIVELTDRK